MRKPNKVSGLFALLGWMMGIICISFPAACILLIVFGVLVARPGLFGKRFQVKFY